VVARLISATVVQRYMLDWSSNRAVRSAAGSMRIATTEGDDGHCTIAVKRATRPTADCPQFGIWPLNRIHTTELEVPVTMMLMIVVGEIIR